MFSVLFSHALGAMGLRSTSQEQASAGDKETGTWSSESTAVDAGDHLVGRPPRALIVASVPEHIRRFHLPYIEALSSQGWEVDVATSGRDPVPGAAARFSVPFDRSPLARSNVSALYKIKRLLDAGSYDIVHVHTPVAAALTRMAAIRARRQGTHVIYTAHGFHFYRGASLASWALYYPVERILARVTDDLLVINQEDLDHARKFRCRVTKVPGVGVDLRRFSEAASAGARAETRAKLGIGPDVFVGICVGELNANKNQRVLIRAWADLSSHDHDGVLLVAGAGPKLAELENLARDLGLERRVKFLGFREDVPQLLVASDVLLAASRREGLPVNVIEAQAAGIPVVASSNRGHRELIEDGVTGVLVDREDPSAWAAAIAALVRHPSKTRELAIRAREKSVRWALEQAVPQVLAVYGITPAC